MVDAAAVPRNVDWVNRGGFHTLGTRVGLVSAKIEEGSVGNRLCTAVADAIESPRRIPNTRILTFPYFRNSGNMEILRELEPSEKKLRLRFQ